MRSGATSIETNAEPRGSDHNDSLANQYDRHSLRSRRWRSGPARRRPISLRHENGARAAAWTRVSRSHAASWRASMGERRPPHKAQRRSPTHYLPNCSYHHRRASTAVARPNNSISAGWSMRYLINVRSAQRGDLCGDMVRPECGPSRRGANLLIDRSVRESGAGPPRLACGGAALIPPLDTDRPKAGPTESTCSGHDRAQSRRRRAAGPRRSEWCRGPVDKEHLI